MTLNLASFSSQPPPLALDWERWMADVSAYAHFEGAREEINKKMDRSHVHLAYDATDDFLRRIDDGRSVALDEALRQLPSRLPTPMLLTRLSKESVLDIGELNAMALLAESADMLFRSLGHWPQETLFILDPKSHQDCRRRFLNPFRLFVSKDAHVDYQQHPELRDLGRRLNSIDARLRTIMQELARSDLFSKRLQFSEHDIINDCYVLAVRSDSYQSSLGPIRARSDSGQTLYVEPLAVKALDQERLDIVMQIDAILSRLCRDYSDILHTHLDLLCTMQALVISVDTLLAKARYAHAKGLVRPEVVDEPLLKLYGLFHPLIENPVRNDVILHTEKGLVISGPNTGGKTATLKAIALSALWVHHGLFVPASEAIIPWFDGLFYVGQDEQNISEGLSSFSAEVAHYLQLISELDTLNLIVIDEIFSSTSSEEASALAIGLFEEIHARATSLILVSTHHQMLKTLMHANADYVSSHVGYDLENERPTYRLILGTPGSSMALSIFESLTKSYGLSHDITGRAQSVLDKKMLMYEGLLQNITQKETQLDHLIDDNQRLQHELSNQKKAMEGVLRLKLEDELAASRTQLNRILNEARTLHEQARENEIESRRQLENRAHDIQSKLHEEERRRLPDKTPNDPNLSRYSQTPSTPLPGRRYYAVPLKKIVSVDSIDPRKKFASVRNGKLKIQISLNDLRDIPTEKRSSSPQVQVHIETNDTGFEIRHDCRGMRLDAFLALIQRGMNALATGAIPFLEIVHGHGNGVLKHELRTMLQKHVEYRFETSDDDGLTRIYFSN